MEEPNTPSEDERLLLAMHNAMEQGDDAAIQSATADLMAHIAKQPRSSDVLLKLQAHQYEALGQWEQAEAAYRQASFSLFRKEFPKQDTSEGEVGSYRFSSRDQTYGTSATWKRESISAHPAGKVVLPCMN